MAFTAATDLATKMRSRADADSLLSDHELRQLADAFDAASHGYFATPQTVHVRPYMAVWARTRKAWCAYSGEPLV